MIHMAIDLDLAEDRLHLAGLVDHERATLNPPVFLAIHALFSVNPIGFRDGFVFVAEQCARQSRFCDEFLMRFLPVETYAKHDGSRLLVRRDGLARIARILATAW